MRRSRRTRRTTRKNTRRGYYSKARKKRRGPGRFSINSRGGTRL